MAPTRSAWLVFSQSTLQRSLRVDQDISDILDVAHLPFAAANFQQRIVGRRLRISRIEQQNAAVSGPETRGQVPVLALDIVHDAATRPGQERRYYQANALARPGRRETQHVFRSIMPEIIALQLAEHDAIGSIKTGDPNL